MMKMRAQEISQEFDCPYIMTNKARNEHFFAMDLTEEELSIYLQTGWRKFGWYYFRPACNGCTACVPLRVLCQEFSPSRSQRKVMQKNLQTEFRICELEYRDEIFDLYQKHSEVRFEQPVDKKEFIETHYFPSCPSLQTEYYADGKLIAVGFLDQSSEGLSSVYFIYDTDYQHLSLGVYGALREIDLARRLHLSYYYLGYWIKENKSMEYKNRYYPHETYDWQKEDWFRREKNS
jgi:leucyl-tRNA---protein transferase